MILKVLSLEPMHGWAIAQRIRQLSKDVLKVNQGALYPALHRLEHQAWVQASWGESENNRRAKYYSLTKAGRERFDAEEKSWDRLSLAVRGVLEAV
jgi:transcriptional regulator